MPSQALANVAELVSRGGVIPAHPLALRADRTLDERRQAALTRYYIDAGASGIAVGVHTTQFAIRQHGMYEPVLRIAAETARAWTERAFLLIAGVTGETEQARAEAEVARAHGYHAVLLNMAALKGRPVDELIVHCTAVGEVMPLVGFALLPEVGGWHMPYEFWRRFVDVPGVVGIKAAPFDRYRTMEIVRAVVEAHAEARVTLFTGNDDHIVLDLLTPFSARRDGADVVVRMRGGLLGHWSVWTKRAVELMDEIAKSGDTVPADLIALDSRVTDSNAAVYDALNSFAGCIPGCLEVLRRQGFLDQVICLDPREKLSGGQLEEIDRVIDTYPELTDDEFVAANLSRWLG